MAPEKVENEAPRESRDLERGDGKPRKERRRKKERKEKRERRRKPEKVSGGCSVMLTVVLVIITLALIALGLVAWKYNWFCKSTAEPVASPVPGDNSGWEGVERLTLRISGGTNGFSSIKNVDECDMLFERFDGPIKRGHQGHLEHQPNAPDIPTEEGWPLFRSKALELDANPVFYGYMGVFLYCIQLDGELHWIIHTGHLALASPKAAINLADFRNADCDAYMRKLDGTSTLLKKGEVSSNWECRNDAEKAMNHEKGERNPNIKPFTVEVVKVERKAAQ